MTENHIKETIKAIKPDTHLETRLKAKVKSQISLKNQHKATQKAFVSLTAICTVVVIILGIGIINSPKPNTNSTHTESFVYTDKTIATGKLKVMASSYDSNAQLTYRELSLNEKCNYELLIKATDTTGYTQEQIKILRNKLDKEYEQFVNKRGNNLMTSRASMCCYENVCFSRFSVDYIKLTIEDHENIENVKVENTSKYCKYIYFDNTVRFCPYPTTPLNLSGNEFNYENHCFYWEFTDELPKLLNENINTPFSTFNDFVTFTIIYKSGETVTATVQFNFNDDGTTTISLCE